MIRRFILGIAVGVLAAVVATPVEAAEWCLNDPALVFAAPHSHHKLTIYATEGVQGAQHTAALRHTHLGFKTRPGKEHGTIGVEVHANIPGNDHDRFSTVLIVSSQPFGAGEIYGIATGTSGHDMKVAFELAYEDGS
jgi:hypothetical protein